MKKNPVIHLILLLCILGQSCSEKTKPAKAFTIRNDTDRKVYIYRLSGVNVYRMGKGPKTIGLGVYHPHVASTYNTFGDLKLDFPIEIEWGQESWDYDARKAGVPPPKGYVQKIYSIKGHSGSRIESGGILGLILENDREWRMEFDPK
jgi:hypothetical protein